MTSTTAVEGPAEGDVAETRLDTSVDALSDVLDLIRLRGEALRAEPASGSGVVRHAAGERLLHAVHEGVLRVGLVGGPTYELGPGDTILLAAGCAHELERSADASWLSGRFVVEESVAAPLLATLPEAVLLHGTDPGLEWLPIGVGILAEEVADPTAGSRVMVSRLLELLFIKTLRAWAAEGGAGGDPGLLTAALDRPLGPALRAIHRRPEHPWAVADLAALASMSRAGFAARFTRLLGEPPARYLARLRLARATDLLVSTDEPVGAIGRAVGYESEAAFSRAFAREYGVAPRAWRNAHLAALYATG